VALKSDIDVASTMGIPQPAGDYDSVALESALLSTWSDEKTFEKSVESRRKGEPFIFLEGPPTANGKPGIHHVVARTFKDFVERREAGIPTVYQLKSKYRKDLTSNLIKTSLIMAWLNSTRLAVSRYGPMRAHGGK
jgi:hypothetical protein